MQRTIFVNCQDETFASKVKRGFVAAAAVLRSRYEWVATSIERGREGPVPERYGGTDGLADTGDCSRNLGNSDHTDMDASYGLGLYCEKIPGKAKNWYFVCQNVAPSGLAVELVNGTLLTWDGRVLRHCTSMTKVGENNSTYGFFCAASSQLVGVI
jgi:hypothetical protein